ncbi:penicillin acylase family protein [Novosphingobium sp.]|uniref:penicillin acylase family protein n=1 Tax=Novosphingobium sp. TaxID=1874826 RepID=UPI0025FD2F6E|nr:penicillin acylase family protein [Novosphingobium sp.]MCC6926520.1 penicillin acylase family protein [Novosphingobium sp.]
MRHIATLTALLLGVSSPALAYQAEIKRDDWGIAHVHGKTDADAVFGMIYAQAEDDFNRIEMNYLTNLGRRAEADGEEYIWEDLRQRLWIDPTELKAQYAASPAWLKELMQAWAAGLNQYLADHPEVKPKVITRFEPWMALSFSEGSIGGDIENVPLSQLEAFYTGQQIAMSADERGLSFREPLGSNGFAIGPSHSASGNPLLLINPHTSFFFRSELQVQSDQGLNAYGAATWGQFFIYQGFNDQAGWMHTSSGIDNVDEFAETVVKRPAGGYAYRYGKEARAVKEKRVTLAFRKGDGSMGSRTFTTYRTHHGPIVRKDGGKWIAFAIMHKPVAALQQSFLRTKTHSLAEFRKVAALRANSSNNTIFASKKGEIAYLHPQFLPVRNDRFDYRKPVDGSNPLTDWKGLTPLAALPTVVNPANGWLFNVNDSPWWAAGKDSPRQAQFPRYTDVAGKEPRTPHAIAVLSARKSFTLDQLLAAAYDPWLPYFAELLPPLVKAHEQAPDPKRAEAVAMLKAWDCKWGLASKETSLAVFWGEALAARGEAAAEAQGITIETWLSTRASNADRLAALDEAMARLTQDFGSWQVPWGEINRYQRNDGAIRQTFDDAKPSTPVPFASGNWGSLASFGSQRYPGTKRYYGTYGNSFVAVVEFGPRVKARAVTAGGESGNPASPHFADQVDRYATGNLRPVYFWPEDLAGHVKAVKVVKGG